MASSSSLAVSGCKSHVRSVSLPSDSHPITISVEGALHSLKHSNSKHTASFESISIGLARLEDLYVRVADLLDMASTQQTLRQQVQDTNALLDSSVLLLDVCGIARDIVSQVREYVQLLQSSIRRRKGDSSTTSRICDYVNFRNNVRKDARRLVSAMKRMKRQVDDVQTSSAMKVLREVDELSTAMLQSVLLPFLNPVSRTKQSRWPSIVRFVHKGNVACEEKTENLDELEIIDAAVYALSKCSLDDAKTTEIQLQHVEDNVNGLELTLESVFRQLVRSRARLLNVVSA